MQIHINTEICASNVEKVKRNFQNCFDCKVTMKKIEYKYYSKDDSMEMAAVFISFYIE